MGLPHEYVRSAVELHTSLGALLERIEHVEGMPVATEGGPEMSTAHVQRLREVFVEIAAARFGINASSGDNLWGVLNAKLEELAKEHDSPSPAKCEQIGRAHV